MAKNYDDSTIYVTSLGENNEILNWQSFQPKKIEFINEIPTPIDDPDCEKVIVSGNEVVRFFKEDFRKYRVVDGFAVFDETIVIRKSIDELQNTINSIKEEMKLQDYKQYKFIRGRLPENEWNELVEWFDLKSEEINQLELQIAEQMLVE